MHTYARGPMVVVALLVAGLGAVAQVQTFRPVTDEMLRNPSPADWLHSRRTYDGWSYSPLDQINRQNVGRCSPATSRPPRWSPTA
jgi:glucose dehydrogenase